ncbi:MAG: dodecin family protein [Thermoproteota archaeon]|nr:dodecin family protein [Thermoproteota archaeon]
MTSKRAEGGEGEGAQTTTTRVAKIVEIVGTSEKSWEDAALVAIEEARKTIRGIRGIKVRDMTARVDPDTGRLVEYRTSVNLSFGVMADED